MAVRVSLDRCVVGRWTGSIGAIIKHRTATDDKIMLRVFVMITINPPPPPLLLIHSSTACVLLLSAPQIAFYIYISYGKIKLCKDSSPMKFPYICHVYYRNTDVRKVLAI